MRQVSRYRKTKISRYVSSAHAGAFPLSLSVLARGLDMFSARSGSEKWLLYIVTFLENPEQNDQKIRESKEVVFHRPF